MGSFTAFCMVICEVFEVLGGSGSLRLVFLPAFLPLMRCIAVLQKESFGHILPVKKMWSPMALFRGNSL